MRECWWIIIPAVLTGSQVAVILLESMPLPNLDSAVLLACWCVFFQSATTTSAFSALSPTTTERRLLHQRLDREVILSQQRQREQELRENHPFDAFNRLFVAVPERPEPIPILETQPLPADFPPGCLLRLGPNGAPEKEAFMDGDGMVHCVTFPPQDSVGVPHYSATYVQTRGRSLEAAAKDDDGPSPRFKGTLNSIPRAIPMLQNLLSNAVTFRTLQAQKDTCNTALAISGTRVLALMEQCPPSEISIRQADGKITTVAHTCRLDGTIAPAPITGGTLSAHGRTIDGERVHVSYQTDTPPYLRVDTFGPGWTPLHPTIGVDIPAPIMLHDNCLTKQHVVLFDFPLTLRTSRFLRDEFPVAYEPEHGARIGLLPRPENGSSTTTIEPQWFDCIPGVILHGVNAFERKNSGGDTIVVVQALRSEPASLKGYLQDYASSFLYEYELNLTTGQVVSEGCLNTEEVLEFPVINESFNGKETESVYCTHVRSIGGKLEAHCQPETGITIDGVTKLSLTGVDKGEIVGQYSLPDCWWGVTEPTVVPKTVGSGEYILFIATEVERNKQWRDIPDSAVRSQVLVLDGDDLNAGPVWTCDLPHHVPYGLHSSYIPWDVMQ